MGRAAWARCGRGVGAVQGEVAARCGEGAARCDLERDGDHQRDEEHESDREDDDIERVVLRRVASVALKGGQCRACGALKMYAGRAGVCAGRAGRVAPYRRRGRSRGRRR